MILLAMPGKQIEQFDSLGPGHRRSRSISCRSSRVTARHPCVRPVSSASHSRMILIVGFGLVRDGSGLVRAMGFQDSKRLPGDCCRARRQTMKPGGPDYL